MAVVGLGHWGPNHARHFGRLARLAALCDRDATRLHAVGKLHPGAACFTSFSDMFRQVDLDAVVIATPTSSHDPLVAAALRRGLHVLCEKPLALRSSSARRLIAEARRRHRVLMVGHTFLFNGGIRHVRELLRRRNLGRIYYLHSKRTHYGLFRPDVSAIWDLASHDVAIFNYLLDAEPTEVSAVGFDWLRKGLQDLGFITLRYPGGVAAHIHVGWLDPKKVREITVVGDRRMAVWQDGGSPGPVTLYDRYVVRGRPLVREFGEFQLLPREGDITIPNLSLEEPLLVQAKEFVAAIRKRRAPLSDGRFAAEVVCALEAVDASIRKRGRPVQIRRAS
ncbi:MAG: Gfo/Idh/MocA family oxidoreductase [Verrucomicrobiae bacterium]|nr:Gfo/Idh/MocA family oxidoreductase [Verrucomicrobiae bacterium]